VSVPVPLERLRAAVDERGGSAYLLTVSDDGSPHAVHAPVRWDGDGIVAEVGKRTAANAAARPAVSLLFPLREQADYSLIVDGTAAVESRDETRSLRVMPTRAVLHRPAAVPDPASPCAADCVPLFPAKRR